MPLQYSEPHEQAAWVLYRITAEQLQASVNRTEDFRADPANAPVLDHVRRMIRETSVEGYTGCAGALRGLNYLPRLGEISVPSLFMTGKSDGSTPPVASEQMHAAVSGSQCVIVDPASHISNLENPAQFDAVLFAHLDAAQNG